MLKELIERAGEVISDYQTDRWITSKSYNDSYEMEKKEEFSNIGLDYEMEEYDKKTIFNFNINFNLHLHMK